MTVKDLLRDLANVPLETEVAVLMNGAIPSREYEVDGAYHVKNNKNKSKKFIIDVFFSKVKAKSKVVNKKAK